MSSRPNPTVDARSKNSGVMQLPTWMWRSSFGNRDISISHCIISAMKAFLCLCLYLSEPFAVETRELQCSQQPYSFI